MVIKIYLTLYVCLKNEQILTENILWQKESLFPVVPVTLAVM